MREAIAKISDKMRSKEHRHRHIIEAAVACFLERGYHQTGVRDIAARAGISLGNIYNHFSGKEAILEEIAALEAEELRRFELLLLADMTAPAVVLKGFAKAYLDYTAQPENALMGLEIVAEAARTPAIADIFAANREGLIRALGRLLEAGISLGRFRPLEDTSETARLILDLIEGLALRSVLSGKRPSAKARVELQNFVAAATGRSG